MLQMMMMNTLLSLFQILFYLIFDSNHKYRLKSEHQRIKVCLKKFSQSYRIDHVVFCQKNDLYFERCFKHMKC